MERKNGKGKEMPADRWKNFNRRIGFLKPGWWIVHLIGITTVYTLGKVLWP
ncbi:MAG: hypothetical protein JSV26_11905 [bacterium]|nr:MAG: hypothetical protein JSV26_11905 [bacterium]